MAQSPESEPTSGPESQREQTETTCSHCGGTGEVLKVVAGREGLIACPSCTGTNATESDTDDTAGIEAATITDDVDVDRPFEPHNGVFVIDVSDEHVGYSIRGPDTQVSVMRVRLNGLAFGPTQYVELEVDDVAIAGDVAYLHIDPHYGTDHLADTAGGE